MSLRSLLLAALFGMAGSACIAADPPPVRASLVKDLATLPGTQGSSPGLFTVLAGRVYFSATAARTGQEMYSTDTQGNLRFLADIAPGPRGSLPEPAAVIGDRLIVTADDGLTGRQLWALPTSGGVPVRLTSMGNNWAAPPRTVNAVATFGTRTLLQVTSQGSGLWSTDGTPGGTYERSHEFGFPLRSVSTGCALDAAAVVAGNDNANSLLVRTDGQPGGDTVIATLPFTSSARASVRVGGYCYFLLFSTASEYAWHLWRTDGTPQGSVELASASGFSASSLVAVGSDVYFLDTADSPGGAAIPRSRLWRLASGATQPQVAIDLTSPLTRNTSLWTHEGQLLFNGYTPAGDSFEAALYSSDGSAAGTRRLYPPAGQSGGYDYWYPVAGGIVVEAGYNNDLRIDLPGGAVSAIDSSPFYYASSALLDGLRIGLGGVGSMEHEVWITAGTQGGTRLLHDIWAETADGVGELGSAAMIGDTLFFTHGFVRQPNGVTLRTLTRTDGSEGGTTALPVSQHQDLGVQQVVRYGDSGVLFTAGYWYSDLYYADAALNSAVVAVSGVYGTFLQSTDNGVGAIHPCSNLTALCGIHPGSGGTILSEGMFSSASPLGQIGRVAIFSNSNPVEIWRSDGTAPGTYRLLAGRYASPFSDSPQDFLLDGKMYLITCTVERICDLTVTDGTLQGTAFLRPMPDGGMIWSARAGSRLVMGTGAGQVWSTDGTAAGTQLLRNVSAAQFVSTGEWVHMKVECSGCKQTHLVTDGTPAGTRLVDLPSGLVNSGWFAAALGDNAVVFSCENARRGNELCLSNASGDRIAALPEIFPGTYPSNPSFVGRTASAVYFSADDGLHGRELWQLRELTDALFADGFDAR